MLDLEPQADFKLLFTSPAAAACRPDSESASFASGAAGASRTCLGDITNQAKAPIGLDSLIGAKRRLSSAATAPPEKRSRDSRLDSGAVEQSTAPAAMQLEARRLEMAVLAMERDICSNYYDPPGWEFLLPAAALAPVLELVDPLAQVLHSEDVDIDTQHWEMLELPALVDPARYMASWMAMF